MQLRIQDPFDSNTNYLLEAVLEACQGALFGAGAFAFASAAGVRLLMGDKTFKEFAVSGKFDLIVGIDSITNIAALTALQTAAHDLGSLNVHAFLHDKKGALFHPKVCWFRTNKGAVVITGSGNLTTGGLRGNWEVFSICKLDNDQADALQAQWSTWKTSIAPFLKLPDDPDVIARATTNIVTRIRRAPTSDAPVTVQEEALAESEELSEGEIFPANLADKVLLAEIPKASDRWNQANFDIDTFTNFFGATLDGVQQRILLYHVDDSGNLGEEESRPSVAVKSQNYRFELAAASGLAYPSVGRPIGVFLRVATRTFRYVLLMPDDANYQVANNFLDAHYSGRKDRMRRVVTNAAVLHTQWPTSPLWLTN